MACCQPHAGDKAAAGMACNHNCHCACGCHMNASKPVLAVLLPPTRLAARSVPIAQQMVGRVAVLPELLFPDGFQPLPFKPPRG